ncbi:MAG: restriction endonuclease [Alphaproteobacteria bacterium GM202ARS2]|nr:restriction endonuclease [Alphaproteobacteria bacterium GM202ARS2]
MTSPTHTSWKTELLHRLQNIDPYQFEKLCGKLLKAMGATNVKVTQRSHDGGIDGTATMHANPLSVDMAFQCKRRKGTIGEKDIRDFLGALTKLRNKQGLFITTGRYTKTARQTAKDNLIYEIHLIDGDDLCSLMEIHRIGIKMQTVIDEAFFADLKKKP